MDRISSTENLKKPTVSQEKVVNKIIHGVDTSSDFIKKICKPKNFITQQLVAIGKELLW